MKIYHRLSFLLLFSILSATAQAQPHNPNVVTLELLGKSLIIFDVSYSRKLTDHIQLGMGLGFQDRSTLTTISGDYKVTDLNVPIFGTYIFGQKKHHAISELGVRLSFTVSKFKESNYWNRPIPFVSFGYEFEGEHFVFRVPIYLAFVGKSELTSTFMPWAGLSFGYPF
ncbi:MAG: hypothetical protein KDC34_14955 [Saprospiraceae bacterium]|nr:hypothetical protein [Saprospiraceae bacterium]